MKKVPFFFLSVFLTFLGNAQSSEQVVQEGKRLYQSEMASWYGTDIFLDRFKDERENIGGYFSFLQDGRHTCLFFSKGDDPTVVATISFDSTFDTSTAIVDMRHNEFTSQERKMYTLRKKSLEVINQDTLFKTYNNTNLNLIPLLDGHSQKVIVLTGPTKNGVVIFGNDYELKFDSSNELLSRKSLHRNIILIYDPDSSKKVLVTMHSHAPESGELITATDICTLMLYERIAGWDQHIVLATTQVSIWDCHKNTITVLSREAWDKIYRKQ